MASIHNGTILTRFVRTQNFKTCSLIILRRVSTRTTPALRSSLTLPSPEISNQPSAVSVSNPRLQKNDGLWRLPTSHLIRNLILGTFFSSQILFKPGFAFVQAVANTHSKLLNVDSNPILNSIIKLLLYDHFCAGRDTKAIAKTHKAITDTGYAGVILQYGIECDVKDADCITGDSSREIEHWRKGNLETLAMMGPGNWLGIKMTGGGSQVLTALKNSDPIPPAFAAAFDEVCLQARAQNCRVYIDSEQAAVQTAIDTWTLDLMRKYNTPSTSSTPLVYNTIQAYLKTSRQKLHHQLHLAAAENFTLGIKLVRGAYIELDRPLIHATKEETDENYNSIVHDLLSGENLGFDHEKLPKFELLIAGHNPETITMSLDLIGSHRSNNTLKVLPEFAQLQGMGDYVGCGFLERCEEIKKAGGKEGGETPKMYKLLTWGSVGECLQYLLRRAVENKGGSMRMRDGMRAYWGELKRRMIGGRVG